MHMDVSVCSLKRNSTFVEKKQNKPTPSMYIARILTNFVVESYLLLF